MSSHAFVLKIVSPSSFGDLRRAQPGATGTPAVAPVERSASGSLRSACRVLFLSCLFYQLSKDQLEAKLNPARVLRRQYLAERGRAEEDVRQVQVCVIECVEELAAELQR